MRSPESTLFIDRLPVISVKVDKHDRIQFRKKREGNWPKHKVFTLLELNLTQNLTAVFVQHLVVTTSLHKSRQVVYSLPKMLPWMHSGKCKKNAYISIAENLRLVYTENPTRVFVDDGGCYRQLISLTAHSLILNYCEPVCTLKDWSH